MRVLLLNQFYRPDTAATGQLLADVAGELVRRGHETHVLCSRRAYGGGERVLPAESDLGGARGAGVFPGSGDSEGLYD